MSDTALTYVESLQAELTASEYRVARALAALMPNGETPMLVQPVSVIAELAGLSVRCVQHQCRSLKLRGILAVLPRRHPETNTPIHNGYSFPALGLPISMRLEAQRKNIETQGVRMRGQIQLIKKVQDMEARLSRLRAG